MIYVNYEPVRPPFNSHVDASESTCEWGSKWLSGYWIMLLLVVGTVSIQIEKSG